MTVEITSFGFLHDAPPAAHLTVDLREHFRDPHVSPELRDLTAMDRAVRDAVMVTPGVEELMDATASAVRAFLSGPSGDVVRVVLGCAGGRHRAATTALELANRLRDQGVDGITVEHRDLHRPVVERAA